VGKLKCPECGHEFEEEEEDLKPKFRSAVRIVEKEWQLAQEQQEKKGFLTEAERVLIKSGVFKNA